MRKRNQILHYQRGMAPLKSDVSVWSMARLASCDRYLHLSWSISIKPTRYEERVCCSLCRNRRTGEKARMRRYSNGLLRLCHRSCHRCHRLPGPRSLLSLGARCLGVKTTESTRPKQCSMQPSIQCAFFVRPLAAPQRAFVKRGDRQDTTHPLMSAPDQEFFDARKTQKATRGHRLLKCESTARRLDARPVRPEHPIKTPAGSVLDDFNMKKIYRDPACYNNVCRFQPKGLVPECPPCETASLTNALQPRVISSLQVAFGHAQCPDCERELVVCAKAFVKVSAASGNRRG